MKLSVPSEEEGAEPGGDEKPDSGHTIGEETVVVFGEEKPVTEAVELIASMVDRPEAFGMVAESSHVELEERVGELEAENERLATSLRQAYRVLDDAESIKRFTMEESDRDPTGALE